MSPIRLSLLLSPVLLAVAVAGCSVRTERTVYEPVPTRSTVVVPSSGYYSYYPTTTYYYRQPYTTYYTSY
jgi:hypothetical protein